MKKLLVITISILLFLSSSYGFSLKQGVQKTLTSNPDVLAERKNQEAYKYYIDEKQSKYLPTLDFNAYLEKSRVKDYYDDDTPDSDNKKDGYNAALVLRQLIYDGGLTPSEVSEMKHQDLANRYRSLNAIENIVLETAKAYTTLVKYDELILLSQGMIKTNEDNLTIAKEKEQISGEVLETYQVSSKLHFATDKFYEEKSNRQDQVNALKKYVGLEVKDKVCRPIVDESILPKSLEEVIKKAILSNYQIKEQIEKIKVQREKIAQNNASFLPTISFELRTSIDDDLELDENGREDETYARLNFDWNLYNGGVNRVKDKQERVFLQEQKKSLDVITDKIVEEVKNQYLKFQNNKKRVETLKKYIDANANIVEVYKNEFEAGTRTFVDILNAQTELYQSIQSLIQREYALYDNYYELLYNLSILGDTILKSKDQDCTKVKAKVYEISPDRKKEEFSDELKELLES
ncbi:transporter [Malaciobacter halophilus]|uniref:Transporter n=1 Tax=Malaciobacter halophilus TaxID=197482 RepID=A0A2N1J1Y5_9BACT|nr:TolC family protein [Malaciobacter halophilus]AXH10807.1 type I secretion system outer membrane protein, TolC family [Malaciobacter halophilus]PKI80492.1 transporter [Malaciobacter halophilus]